MRRLPFEYDVEDRLERLQDRRHYAPHQAVAHELQASIASVDRLCAMSSGTAEPLHGTL